MQVEDSGMGEQLKECSAAERVCTSKNRKAAGTAACTNTSMVNISLIDSPCIPSWFEHLSIPTSRVMDKCWCVVIADATVANMTARNAAMQIAINRVAVKVEICSCFWPVRMTTRPTDDCKRARHHGRSPLGVDRIVPDKWNGSNSTSRRGNPHFPRLFVRSFGSK
jgi:hypothetical protein